MSLAPGRSTTPMSVPWINARREQPNRLLITLERRVSLVVEDGERPIAELHARVFQMELVGLLTIEREDGSIVEQRRVRANVADAARFAAAVVEQAELACHLCPGITVAVTRNADPAWDPVRVGLATLSVEGEHIQVLDVLDRAPLTVEDIELTRRARRRPLGTPPPYGPR
jgi:hypothetical protein